MPKLTVQNLAQLQVKIAPGQTLLKALHAQGQDWMHACGGKGRCTTCRIIVGEGMAGFGPLSPAEEKYRQQQRLGENERLTCQCCLTLDARGRVPEQTKFPHMEYSP